MDNRYSPGNSASFAADFEFGSTEEQRTRPTVRPVREDAPHLKPVREDAPHLRPVSDVALRSSRVGNDCPTPKIEAFDDAAFEGAPPPDPVIPRATPLPRSVTVAVALRAPEIAPLRRAIREEVRCTRRDPRAEEDDD